MRFGKYVITCLDLGFRMQAANILQTNQKTQIKVFLEIEALNFGEQNAKAAFQFNY